MSAPTPWGPPWWRKALPEWIDRSRWRPCTKLWLACCHGQIGWRRAFDAGSQLHWMPWAGPLPLDASLRDFARRCIAAHPHPCA